MMADGSTHHDLPPITGSGEHATVSYLDYLLAIRAGDAALQAERDRRYAEVDVEREKALKIKEVADLAALQLAREIQTYKDEKANELREQISSERGLYASKADLSTLREYFDALHRPVLEFIAGQRQVDTVKRLDIGQLVQVLAVMVAIAAVLFAVLKK
jgi:hypothetical protein